MTNNPTIDGVSRELLLNKCVCGSTNISFCYESPQGHWILCDECGETSPSFENKGSALDHWNKHAPAVERQEPAGYVGLNALGGLRGSDGYLMMSAKPERYLDIPVYRAAPEVAALQSTIAQLQARLQELESGSKPVLIQAVAVTRNDEDEGLRLEWLLEGGISELEFAGQVLFAMPEANGLCDETGSAEVYAAPPTPVAVELLRKARGSVSYLSLRADDIGDENHALLQEINACLDANAAMNGERE